MDKPVIAVWKFSSCDGCQLSLLDCEDEILAVAGAVEIGYFMEASKREHPGPYDLSIVEGSITTPEEKDYTSIPPFEFSPAPFHTEVDTSIEIKCDHLGCIAYFPFVFLVVWGTPFERNLMHYWIGSREFFCDVPCLKIKCFAIPPVLTPSPLPQTKRTMFPWEPSRPANVEKLS